MTPSVKDRLFIAFGTPDIVREDISAATESLRRTRRDVRWESEEKFHCTIAFLGDTDREKVEDILAALGGLRVAPFTVVYRTLGCFPERGEPRVVWVGIENPDGRLESLARQIDELLRGFGIERDRGAFRPHLTIGRVNRSSRARDLLAIVETITFESQPVTIRNIEVIKSVLKPSGSVYTILKSIPLSA